MSVAETYSTESPTDHIESRALPRVALVATLALIALTYVFYGWDRLVMPVELVELRRALGLDLRTAGLMASIFTLGIAVLSLPAGFLVQRFGMRRAMGFSTLLFSSGTLASGLAQHIPVLVAGRIATGAGEAVFSVALLTFITALFPRWRGTAIGGATTIFGLSMSFGPRIVLDIQRLGGGDWRFPFLVMGGGGIAFGLLLLFCLPRIAQAHAPALGVGRQWSWLRSRPLQATYLVALVNGLCCYAYMSVFQTYARVGQHLSPTDAATAFGFFGLGNILGGMPIGVLLDRTNRRLGVGILGVLTGIAGAVLIIWTLTPLSAVVLSVVFGIGIGGIYGNCYALCRDLVPAESASLAIGLLLTVYYLGASASGYLFVTVMGDDFSANLRGAVVMFLVPYVVAGATLMAVSRARYVEAAP